MHLSTTFAATTTLLTLAAALPKGTLQTTPKPDTSICVHQNNPPETRMLVVGMTPKTSTTSSSFEILLLDQNCKAITMAFAEIDPKRPFKVKTDKETTVPELEDDVLHSVTVPSAEGADDWEVKMGYLGEEKTWNPTYTEGCSLKKGDGVDGAALTLGCTFFSDSGFPLNIVV